MTTATRKLDLGLAREVVRMSLPLMGTMAGNLLMMLVDRICLAQYSSDTLAASRPPARSGVGGVGGGGGGRGGGGGGGGGGGRAPPPRRGGGLPLLFLFTAA